MKESKNKKFNAKKLRHIEINGETISVYPVNEKGKNAPIFILNGGPGGSLTSTLAYLSPLGELTNRPIIFYDQIGGALSQPKEEKHPSFWCMETWMDELMSLVKALNYEKAILLGHSFGGMLAIATAIEKKPSWLKGLILSSTLCSSKMWEEDAKEIMAKLPKKVRQTLINGARTGEFLTPEYKKAEAVYLRACVNPKYRYSEKKIKFNPAYYYGWGPSEFSSTGTLKDYDYSSRLGEIEVPTLLLCGGHDESTPKANEFMFNELICPKSKVVLENSHHRSYAEENEKYLEAVLSFLRETKL